MKRMWNLSGFLGIRLDLPARIDVPADDDAVGWLVREHARRAALAAVKDRLHPTRWDKFTSAAEINDLFDGSPLEDRLWAEFKRYDIPAERQDWVKVDGQQYALDFAIYCGSGSIDVETDGDSWHGTPERAARDNLRDNALQAKGWTVLRFSTPQVQERAAEYCIPKVAETINQLGGLDEGRVIPRNISIAPGSQLGLFDVL